MISEPFSNWWCCLNPRERNTLVALLPFWMTNPLYLERSAFDFIVATTGESSSIKMLESFMTTYGLQYQDIPCGEDCVIHAVVFEVGFWLQLYNFSNESSLSCTKPCTYLTFPL